jgi:hypothetical protein
MPRRKVPLRQELGLAIKEAAREVLRMVTVRRGARSGQAYIVLSWPRWKRLGKVQKRIASSLANSKPALAGFASFVLFVAGTAGLAYSIAPLVGQQKVTAVTTQPTEQPPAPTPTTAIPVAQPTYLASSQPTRLAIPAIGVDTELTTVTLDSNGVLQPPDRFDIAGWYDKSPTPGELGPSVIVGHVDSLEGPAVFFYVKTLQPGQIITATRADGTSANFTVEKVALYDQDNFPTQEVYGNIDHAGLRIITCGGAFNPFTGKYEQNTVVYARLAV